jgi:hypothetical protein
VWGMVVVCSWDLMGAKYFFVRVVASNFVNFVSTNEKQRMKDEK